MIETINPEPGVLKQLADEMESQLPVTMINLLAFRDTAAYSQGMQDNATGLEAYSTYSKLASSYFQQVGGELVYYGELKGIVIGPADDRWHQVLIARYPNFGAFLNMVANPEYQAITHHRTAALQNSRLWATQAV